MWKLSHRLLVRPGEGLPPDRALPAERDLMARWERENPAEYRRLVRAGKALQAARNALTLKEPMDLGLRVDNPGMTAMEADQHTRNVLNLAPVDPS